MLSFFIGTPFVGVRFEIEDNGIHAVAHACGGRTIVKEMAEVCAAAAAEYFGAAHAVGVVGVVDGGIFAEVTEEEWERIKPVRGVTRTRTVPRGRC